MTDNVISLNKAKQERLIPTASYFIRVDMYGEGIAGEILDLGELEEGELRGVADNLQALARWYRQQAFDLDGDADNELLAEFQVFASSRVWSYIDNQIEGAPRCDWLKRRLDDAKETI